MTQKSTKTSPSETSGFNVQREGFAKCDHCGLDIVVPYPLKPDNKGEPEGLFCCHGCRTVYQILFQQGLQRYYGLKREVGAFENPIPATSAELEKKEFAYLDREDFQKDHVIPRDEKRSKIRFYLEGVHCLACLWLIENLPNLHNKVFAARLNMAQSVVDIEFSPDVSLSEIASLLASWGYRPHPLKNEEERERLQKEEERKMLRRIGIAAFSAGNIMIYAVSLYGGASGTMASFFGAITLLLALPVLTYSAWPFYQTAWGNLKSRHVSIDLPIALALIIGGTHGLANTLRGIPENYFDSLTTLVFLLLFSRYLVKKTGQSGLNRDLIKSFFSLGNVERWNREQQCYEPVAAEYLKRQDTIKVSAGKPLPCDGLVQEGESSLDTSTLTGEPLPRPVAPGDVVKAGTINNENDLIISVTSTAEDTEWGDLLQKIESGWAKKGPTTRLLDKIAEKFVLAVFTTSVLTFLYFTFLHNSPLTGFERALGLIIISCPCALGLAAPLAMTRGLASSASQGLILKDEESFERLSHVDALALDKTGTLTQGRLQVLSWPSEPPNLPDELNNWTFPGLVYFMEKDSRHPVAKALCEEALGYLSHEEQKALDEFSHPSFKKREILASGIELQTPSHRLFLGTQKSEDNTFDALTLNIELRLDDKTLAFFQLQDQIRPEAKSLLQRLQKRGMELWILTGDSETRALSLANEIGISHEFVKAHYTPAKKYDFIKAEQDRGKTFAMIGDGANDALALSQASVGIAVQGSAEVGLKAADVYLTQTGLAPLEKLFQLSDITMRIIKRNLTFSLLYNTFGALGALSGVVTPLWAAVFMPLSSLTVLGSTLLGSRQKT